MAAKPKKTIDLDGLGLAHGEAATVDAQVGLESFQCYGLEYRPLDRRQPVSVDISHTVSGWALVLKFNAPLKSACVRCLKETDTTVAVDTRELEQLGDDEQFHSPYIESGILDIERWARDSLILAAPQRLLCKPDCRGLCSHCGADLNKEDPKDHKHGEGGDPRMAKLKGFHF